MHLHTQIDLVFSRSTIVCLFALYWYCLCHTVNAVCQMIFSYEYYFSSCNFNQIWLPPSTEFYRQKMLAILLRLHWNAPKREEENCICIYSNVSATIGPPDTKFHSILQTMLRARQWFIISGTHTLNTHSMTSSLFFLFIVRKHDNFHYCIPLHKAAQCCWFEFFFLFSLLFRFCCSLHKCQNACVPPIVLYHLLSVISKCELYVLQAV